jgi:hypothetical protein
MKIKVDVKDKTNLKKVKGELKKANFNAVKDALLYLRQSTLNNIRKGEYDESTGRRKVSPPGGFPAYWDRGGKKKRQLAYGGNGKRHSRYIGFKQSKVDNYGKTTALFYASPADSGDRVMEMLEMGGSQPVEVYKGSGEYTRIVANRTYRRDKQPDWKSNHHKPMSERSEGERRYISAYYNNTILRRNAKKVKRMGRYKPRPFLMSTLREVYSRFPAIWKKQINGNFR